MIYCLMFDLEVNIEDQVNISISINYVESLPCGTFCVCLFQIFFSSTIL